MPYLVEHHGTYWFSIRVPACLQERFGPLVRVNLQTQDRPFAKQMALRLAAEWLSRFDAARAGVSPPCLPAGVETWSAAPQFTITPEPQAPAAPTKPKAGRSASDAELLKAWKRLDPDRVSTTVRDAESAAREFHRAIRIPLARATRADVSAYRDHLLKRGAARGTVAKRIGMISTLLQVGVDSGLLDTNVARGMRIPKADIPTLIRRAFTPAELERLFALPVFRGGPRSDGAGGDACVWMPMLALATGARLEELAQLRSADIECDPTHGPLIQIRDEHREQHLKNMGSRRTIPVHPALVEAGFLDYSESVREAGHEWLFPVLVPDHDGRRGANFGKWFMRTVRAKSGVNVEDPRVVFHSFRHGFKTLCRAAGLNEEIHDALTGHVSGSVSRTYGEMPVAPLVEAMTRIKLPVALPRIGREAHHG